MANYNALNEQTMERALKLATALGTGEVAVALDISYPSVVKILAANRAAKAGDLEKLMAVGSKNIISWAAERNGFDLTRTEPEPVEEAPAEEPKRQDAENEALAVVKVLTALESILLALGEINGALSRLNGRVANVEAAMAGTVTKDVLNANVNLLLDAIGGQ